MVPQQHKDMLGWCATNNGRWAFREVLAVFGRRLGRPFALGVGAGGRLVSLGRVHMATVVSGASKQLSFRWSLCYILVPRYVAHKGGGVDMSGW